MFFPIPSISLSQRLVVDHKQILGIILFSSLGKIERPRNHGLSVNYHHLVVGNGVLDIYLRWNA